MQRLLSNCSVFETQSIDDACSGLSRLFTDTVLFPDRSSKVDAHCSQAKFSQHVSLIYLDFRADLKLLPRGAETFYLLQMPLSGSCTLSRAGEVFKVRARESFAINPNDSISMHWNRNCSQLIVKMDRQALEDKLSQLLRRPISNPIGFASSRIDSYHRADAWWHMIRALVREIDHNHALYRSKQFVTAYENTILTGVLYAFSHSYTEALLDNDVRIAPCYVKSAEEYIQEHIQERLSIAEIADHAGVSSRSVFNGFRKYRGLTPMQYLLKCRLNHVHRDLHMATRETHTVTEIAAKWGFSQMGRFARAYRKVYGESPCETLGRGPRQR